MRLLHLHRCRGMTRRFIRLLYRLDPTLHHVYELTPSEITKNFSIPVKRATNLYHDLHDQHLKHRVKIDANQFHTFTIVDAHYPSMLKTIKDPPIVLYGLGNASFLHEQPAISVIGTRNPSEEARRKTNHLVIPLAKRNWMIVSGLAKGIDSFAHQAALAVKGRTIAVLGCGLKHIYPKQNTALFQQIVRSGLVISEYPPHEPPKPYYFPERNRIISGLSFSTLVVEAAMKSGTLITVDQALDQGREVYAIPGSPFIPQTIGCHQMIQDGAKLVYEATDIMEDWEQLSRCWNN